MKLRNTLNRIVRVLIEEAERNPGFDAALKDAIGSDLDKSKAPQKANSDKVDEGVVKRGKNRRAAASLDPVQLVRDGEAALRNALEGLSLEQLRDIVAEYGMDPGRLVMKWNTPERVIDRVVEMAVARAQKGSAFRKPHDESQLSVFDTEEKSTSNAVSPKKSRDEGEKNR